MTASRSRLDHLLPLRFPGMTRSRAQDLIRRGQVQCQGDVITKPGTLVSETIEIKILEDWDVVGRGALKLKPILETLGDKTWTEGAALDVGSSTGGFTQVLLDLGCPKVFALDVGTDQLAPKLRLDPRVISLENTDIRHLQTLPDLIHFVTIDVSFLRLQDVLPEIPRFLAPHSFILALFKPQFEVQGKERTKTGVVKDPKLRNLVRERFLNWCQEHFLSPLQEIPSPLPGKEGNLETFFLFQGKSHES